MSLPPDYSYDPLLNALIERASYGAPYKGETESSSDAIHAAAIAALAMAKLGSRNIRAVAGQGNCNALWDWMVTALQHHGARCDALACVQCLWCTPCEYLDEATPDLHGCEHHAAGATLQALLLEWIGAERDFLAEIIDKLGESGVWLSSDASSLPNPHPYEQVFGQDVSRIARDQ